MKPALFSPLPVNLALAQTLLSDQVGVSRSGCTCCHNKPVKINIALKSRPAHPHELEN